MCLSSSVPETSANTLVVRLYSDIGLYSILSDRKEFWHLDKNESSLY